MNLRFYLFASCVNQRNGGRGGEFKISLCYPRGLGAFPQLHREWDGGIWCLWSVCRWLSQWCLVFVLLNADATLGDRCGIWNICIVSVVKLQVPSSGNPAQRVPNWWSCLRILNQGESSLNFMGGQFLILTLWNLSSESVGAWNFEILVEDSDTGGPSSVAAQIESFFVIFVQISICELCLKNDEGEAESIIKWGGWGGSSLHGKKSRKIYQPFKILSLNR